MILRVLSRIEPGPVIACAADGEAALKALGLDSPSNGKASLPHLILLDIKMPRLSGLEVLERARQDPRFRSTPIVMLTSSDDPDDVETAQRLGATGYLVKSLDLAEFDLDLRRVVLYCLGRESQLPVSSSCLFLK